MSEKVIFLNVNVLMNEHSSNIFPIYHKLLMRLKEIIIYTNASIVLIGEWAHDENKRNEFDEYLIENNMFKTISYIDEEHNKLSAILSWLALDTQSNVISWVILDKEKIESNSFTELKNYYRQISPDGLQEDDVSFFQQLLNNNNNNKIHKCKYCGKNTTMFDSENLYFVCNYICKMNLRIV